MKTIVKAMALLLIGATSCSNYNADLIIHNARIYTVNDSFELASTLNTYVIAENEAFQIQSFRSKAIQ